MGEKSEAIELAQPDPCKQACAAQLKKVRIYRKTPRRRVEDGADFKC